MIAMPLDKYLADPCVEPSLDSSTAWKLITRSPLHAWSAHPRLNPSVSPCPIIAVDFETGEATNVESGGPSKTNAAMDIGAAAHALFLEGDDSRFEIVAGDNWRTKAAREQRDAAHDGGRIPLLVKQWEKVQAIAEASKKAVDLRDELLDVFTDSVVEHVCLWQEGETWCRARPDLISADRKVVLNYKTTGASASPDRFGVMMVRDGYHIQAYHHARGIAAETGEMPKCLWLAQETDPPYAASVLGASPALMELAALQWKHALSIWRECMNSGRWPAYPSRICWVEPKAWELEQWASRPDVEATEGCRMWNENRELCGSHDRVTLIDGVPYCASCLKKREEIEQEIFG